VPTNLAGPALNEAAKNRQQAWKACSVAVVGGSACPPSMMTTLPREIRGRDDPRVGHETENVARGQHQTSCWPKHSQAAAAEQEQATGKTKAVRFTASISKFLMNEGQSCRP